MAIYENVGKSCRVGQLSAVSILCDSTNSKLAEQLKVSRVFAYEISSGFVSQRKKSPC